MLCASSRLLCQFQFAENEADVILLKSGVNVSGIRGFGKLEFMCGVMEVSAVQEVDQHQENSKQLMEHTRTIIQKCVKAQGLFE